jgi:hypothetical protein
VPDMGKKWRVPRYVVVASAILLIAVIGVATEFAVQNRRDAATSADITRAESDLRELGGQIAAIKDGDLTSMNDFIAADAQVEPLEKEYDQKLQKFTELYRTAKERDSHRSLLDFQRLRGSSPPRELGENVANYRDSSPDQRHYEARDFRSTRNGISPGA